VISFQVEGDKMGTTDSIQSEPLASSTTPITTVPEPPPIAIQGRIGMAMFLIVGFLLGVIVLMDLLSAIFR
jgi:hypothetical protein